MSAITQEAIEAAASSARVFIGAPTCRLRRYTKPSAAPAYFCDQCRLFTKVYKCPFAAPVLNEAGSQK